jgi:hypothetical protein
MSTSASCPLPPKADIAERYWDVRFVPEADIGGSIDDLVGASGAYAAEFFKGNFLPRFGWHFTVLLPTDLSVSQASSKAVSRSTRV